MRHVFAVGVLVVFIAMTGCLGGGPITQSDLDANASYDWSTETTVRYNVTGETFTAVTQVTNGTAVEAYRVTEFQGEQPIRVSAVRFRYPNGSVVTVNVSAVEQTDSRTVIDPPADDGKLGYTARSFPKEFTVGVARAGSYEVVLPRDMRIGIPLLGTISPGGAELRVVDDRVHLRWSSLSGGEIALHYYLERDFWLFTALVVGLTVIGIFGAIYYWFRIQQLEDQRRATGLEVED